MVQTDKKIRAYFWPGNNFGDKLSPIILEHFMGKKIVPAGRNETGKILAVGSIMTALRENDVVWGAGTQRRTRMEAPRGAKFLAFRGPWTRSRILSRDKLTEVYGDPAILLPLIYYPVVDKTCKVGIIPHYVDKQFVNMERGQKMIDIQADWKTVIREILSCDEIISSSLHGIVCAEAYGIPARWAVYSKKILGGSWKFQDYFLGTGRGIQEKMRPIPPIEGMEERQQILINALKKWINQISPTFYEPGVIGATTNLGTR